MYGQKKAFKPFSQADYDDQDDDGYGGGGPVQFQLDLGDGLTVTNLTEDWFASSRRPRRVRQKTVIK